jgi:hypothetical protein
MSTIIYEKRTVESERNVNDLKVCEIHCNANIIRASQVIWNRAHNSIGIYDDRSNLSSIKYLQNKQVDKFKRYTVVLSSAKSRALDSGVYRICQLI